MSETEATTPSVVSEESEPEPDVFIVEKILDKEKRNRRWWYLLKWQGYDATHNSWEPKCNLRMSTEELATFEKSWKAEQRKKELDKALLEKAELERVKVEAVEVEVEVEIPQLEKIELETVIKVETAEAVVEIPQLEKVELEKVIEVETAEVEVEIPQLEKIELETVVKAETAEAEVEIPQQLEKVIEVETAAGESPPQLERAELESVQTESVKKTEKKKKKKKRKVIEPSDDNNNKEQVDPKEPSGKPEEVVESKPKERGTGRKLKPGVVKKVKTGKVQGSGSADSSASAKKPTGFARGLEADFIIGVTELHGELMYLMKWKGSEEADLVPGWEANVRCPQLVILYLEERMYFPFEDEDEHAPPEETNTDKKVKPSGSSSSNGGKDGSHSQGAVADVDDGLSLENETAAKTDSRAGGPREVDEVISAKRDRDEELVYLVRFKSSSEAEFVPASVLYAMWPEAAIRFFEERIVWGHGEE